MPKANILILGPPLAKPRPKFSRQGAFVRAYSPKAKEEKLIVKEIRSQWKGRPIDDPVVLGMKFWCPMPKASKRATEAMLSGKAKHVKKPDIDNLGKGALDLMVAAGVLADDRQVYELALEKVYGDVPRTEITVEW